MDLPVTHLLDVTLYLVRNNKKYLAKLVLNRNFLAPPEIIHDEVRDPCYPSPCGPNSECRNSNGVPSCSCLHNYIGAPPNCRPECTINSECTSNRACIREKCVDPCPGSCGVQAQCSVINHTPICTCIDGYKGDPFVSCQPAPPPRKANRKSIPNFKQFKQQPYSF